MGSPIFQFNFTETAADLTHSYEAHRTSELRMRRWARVFVGLYGLMFLLFLPFAWASGQSVPWWQGLAWLSFGALLSWHFVGKPILIRRALWLRPDQPVAVEISDSGLTARLGTEEHIRLYWDEFVTCLAASKGIGLGFRDGTRTWLPERVFTDRASRQECEAFLKSKLPMPR